MRKSLVITATACEGMENLRLAVEVLTGKRVRFVHLDFNTLKCKVLISGKVVEILADTWDGDTIHFAIVKECEWYHARFDRDEVRVSSDRHKSRNGEHSMCWVGSSMTDRREEPLDLPSVNYCAEMRGLTTDEYLSK
jgi:hypothetical protein